MLLLIIHSMQDFIMWCNKLYGHLKKFLHIIDRRKQPFPTFNFQFLNMKKGLLFLLLPLMASAQSKRLLKPDDIYNLKYVGAPVPSPDGKWIAYTVRTMDSSKDKQNTDIWMVSRDGTQSVQLTNSPDGEGNPQWSPDGKYLSFTASRQGGSQLWILDRCGGEAQKFTDVKGELSDYAWSPDAKKILL